MAAPIADSTQPAHPRASDVATQPARPGRQTSWSSKGLELPQLSIDVICRDEKKLLSKFREASFPSLSRRTHTTFLLTAEKGLTKPYNSMPSAGTQVPLPYRHHQTTMRIAQPPQPLHTSSGAQHLAPLKHHLSRSAHHTVDALISRDRIPLCTPQHQRGQQATARALFDSRRPEAHV